MSSPEYIFRSNPYRTYEYHPFSDIWNLLENEERRVLINKSDCSISKAKIRNMCDWFRCDHGSMDERIWFKIPERLRTQG
jgi:hypothetical protein